jgi:hypothetical protein
VKFLPLFLSHICQNDFSAKEKGCPEKSMKTWLSEIEFVFDYLEGEFKKERLLQQFFIFFKVFIF